MFITFPNDIESSVTLVFKTDEKDAASPREQKIREPFLLVREHGCRLCLLALLTGFEPAIYGVGVRCDIQLRYSNIFTYGMFRCSQF